MNRSVVRQYMVLAASLLTIAFNGLANALPLNGLTTGEISDRFAVLFVPAGYVFSIWGLIYLGIMAFSIYQILPSRREDPVLKRVSIPFMVSCIANIAWLYLWHHEHFVLTLVAMLILLLSLIVIYLRLGTGRSPARPGERWCVRVPFSLYIGWISVATIANVSTVLTFLGWDGWGVGPEVWTIVLLGVGVVLAAAMSLTRGDLAYDMVLIWAFTGIAVKHAANPVVSTGAWIASGLVAGLLLLVTVGVGPHRCKDTPPESAQDNERLY